MNGENNNVNIELADYEALKFEKVLLDRFINGSWREIGIDYIERKGMKWYRTNMVAKIMSIEKQPVKKLLKRIKSQENIYYVVDKHDLFAHTFVNMAGLKEVLVNSSGENKSTDEYECIKWLVSAIEQDVMMPEIEASEIAIIKKLESCELGFYFLEELENYINILDTILSLGKKAKTSE